MIGIEMLGCDIGLPLESAVYRNRTEVLTPPQSSPESHHNGNVNPSSRGYHPLAEITLPQNIPDVLLCKFGIVRSVESAPVYPVDIFRVLKRTLTCHFRHLVRLRFDYLELLSEKQRVGRSLTFCFATI